MILVAEMASWPAIVNQAAARTVLAFHRPTHDRLCQGCLDGARLAAWPCPQATRAARFLAETAGERGDRP
jgi:hypothetical protein